MRFILFLTFVVSAQAGFTEQDAMKQKKQGQEAAAAADSELPPCEGHDHFDDVIRRFSPPGSCPKAKEFFEFQLKISQGIRDNCRDTTRWMEERLRNPDYCRSDAARAAAYKKISALKTKSQEWEESEELERVEKLLDGSGVDLNFEGKAPTLKGEWARLECSHSVFIALQFRSRQRSLANKHFGMADNAIGAVCDEGPAGAEDYLNFVRGGEDAL